MKGCPVSAYLLFQIINCFCIINKILRRALLYLIFFQKSPFSHWDVRYNFENVQEHYSAAERERERELEDRRRELRSKVRNEENTSKETGKSKRKITLDRN